MDFFRRQRTRRDAVSMQRRLSQTWLALRNPIATRQRGLGGPPASSRVRTVAVTSLQPLVFCPAHNAEKSPLPWLSALARSGARADVARGNAGTALLIGPRSLMSRFTMPRA